MISALLKAILLLPFKPFIIAGKAWWKFLDGVECSSSYRIKEYKPPTTHIGKAWDRFTTILIYAPCYFITTVFDSNALWSYAINRERFGYYKLDKRKYGFTLVEMAIVILIIGTIVGGVLVGKEMITGVEIKKMTSQFEQTETAVNAFKLKYNCLPGDCPNAQQFGLLSYESVGGAPSAYSNGNGDGSIFSNEYWTNAFAGRENIQFWLNLVQTNLLTADIPCPNRYDTTNGCNGHHEAYLLGRTTPQATVGGDIVGVGIISTNVFTSNDTYFIPARHAIRLGRHTSLNQWNEVLTPINAYSLDQKFDDGLPYSGRVRAFMQTCSTSSSCTFSAAATGCVQNGLYNVSATGKNCDLYTSMGF